MLDIKTIKQWISDSKRTDKLLYSDPRNPYESIYISAKIIDGKLTVTDSECEHGPDGGWSHRIISFDEENTEKGFAFLLDRNADPFQALADMLSYKARTADFLDACNAKEICFENHLEW